MRGFSVAIVLTLALITGPADAAVLHLCAKADIRGPDPTAAKNNSPIKLREECHPVKEVSLGTTEDLAEIQANKAAIALKADQSEVDANTSAIAGKADQSVVDANTSAIGANATVIEGKGDQSAVDANTMAIAGKADQSSLFWSLRAVVPRLPRLYCDIRVLPDQFEIWRKQGEMRRVWTVIFGRYLEGIRIAVRTAIHGGTGPFLR